MTLYVPVPEETLQRLLRLVELVELGDWPSKHDTQELRKELSDLCKPPMKS